VSHESNALAWQCSYEVLRFSGVADRCARCIDPGRERGVGHNPTAPNSANEVILRNNSVAVLHKIQNEVEHLRLNRNRRTATPKLAAIGIKNVVIEEKCHSTFLNGSDRFSVRFSSRHLSRES
jgi:hypothetical protein